MTTTVSDSPFLRQTQILHPPYHVIDGKMLPTKCERLTSDRLANLCGWLEIIGGKQEDEILLYKDADTVVGRHPKCNYVLPQPAVSGRHFTISYVNGTVFCKDHSSNGTFIKKDLVRGAAKPLCDGDVITVRQSASFVFHSINIDNGALPVNNEEYKERIASRYIITSQILGTGAFSTVYRGVDIHAKRPLAVKVMKREKFPKNAPEKSGTNYLREIKTLKSLQHPNVMRLYDAVELPDAIYLFTEYAGGGDLFSFILRKNKLEEAQTKFIAYQLISALKYLHKRGIAHRDIKPENILLMESTDMPHIILSDFGMAKMIKETTDRKNTFCGTFHYLAPEVIYAGKSSSTMPSYLRNYDFSKCDPSITNGYGLKADLWSAGVVIYTMLTGTMAFSFSDANTQQTIDYMVNHPIDFPESEWGHISAEAKDFIAKLIERDPGKRMSAGEALAHPWITLDKERLEQQCYEIVGPFKESTDYVNLVSQREQDNHNSDIMQEDTVTPMDEEKKINPALHAQPSGRSGAARKTQPPPAPGTLRTVMTRSKARGMAEADAASASKRLRPNA